MALIFKEPLDLPPIPLPKKMYDSVEASNEAFYTTAALDYNDVEATYLKINQDLLNNGYSDLQEVAINKYKSEQNQQNKNIVDSLIADPAVDMQDKKNALELYATGGYISSDLKKRYQNSLISPINMDSIDETENQKAALDGLEIKRIKNNDDIVVEKIHRLEEENKKISSDNTQLPKNEIAKKIEDNVVKQAEILVQNLEESTGFKALTKLDGNIFETQIYDPGLAEGSNLVLDAVNIGEFVVNMIRAVASFGATAIDVYGDEIEEQYNLAVQKFKEQNKAIYNKLPLKVKNWVDLTFDLKKTELLLDKSTKTESKINIDFLQTYYNTESGFNKIAWTKNAKLAPKRLDPNNENYKPEYVENLEILLDIVNKEGKYVFKKELQTLQDEYGIYSKHINLALSPIYSAETTFGTNNQVSSGGAVGELQVVYSTFKDLIAQGYLGKKYVETINEPLLVNNLDDLKKLSKKDFISLLSNNSVAAILAGEAKLLQMIKDKPDGFLTNVEAKGDLTEKGINDLNQTPKLTTWNEKWEKNFDINDRYFGLTPKEEGELNVPTQGTILSKNPIKTAIVNILPNPDFFKNLKKELGFTQEEIDNSVTGAAFNTLGEAIHYLQEQLVEHGYADGPGSARAMIDSVLIFAPLLKGFAPKRFTGGRKKSNELLTEDQAIKDFEAAADMRNPNWRDRYTKAGTGTEAPVYGKDNYTSPQKDVPPESPLKATSDVNNAAGVELSLEVLKSPLDSPVSNALGVTKLDIFSSYVDFNYGSHITLGGTHPDLNGVSTKSSRNAREIFEEYKNASDTHQSINYTYVTKVKENINRLVTSTNGFSPSHSRISKVTNESLNSDLSFRNEGGAPLIGKDAVVDKFNGLINNPNLNAINNISKSPGGSIKKPVARNKGKVIYENNNFIDTKVYIRDLNTGETYYSIEHFNKTRKYLSPDEQILMGPPNSVDVTIPSYTQNGKVIPEKIINVPIKIKPTGKKRATKLKDKGVLIQDLHATLRRKADKSPHEILVDVKGINKTFSQKPWLSPKVPGVIPLPDIFKTKEQWVDFVVKHEIAHAFNPINPKVESKADYENRINRIALKEYKEQFDLENTSEFEVMLEIRSDYDVLITPNTPIAVNKLRMGFKGWGSFTYNPNVRIKNIDIYKYFLQQQRDAPWVNTELIDKALENSYLSKKMANLLVAKFTGYKNPDALAYLLKRMYKEGRSINSYSNRELFNMFGPLINDPKVMKITGIKSIEDIPPLIEAADAFEQIAKLERAIKNVYERNRLEREGYNRGVYENKTNKNLFIVSDQLISTRNKKVTEDIIRLQEDGSVIIEVKDIDIPWITANIKQAYDVRSEKVIPFEFSKELSHASAERGENFIYDTQGRVLVKTTKPLNTGKQLLDDVYNIETKRIEEPRDFGKVDTLDTKETLPPIPGMDHYKYILVDSSTLNIGALPTNILEPRDGYSPQIDQSLWFVDIIPMMVRDNGTVIYDYRNGKVNKKTFELEPITDSELTTMIIFEKYSQAVARSQTKTQAENIVRSLEDSGYYNEFRFRVRGAKESDSKWAMRKEQESQLIYESELNSSKQFNKDIVGQPDIMDVGEALSRQATNQLKQGLHTPAYNRFKQEFVKEFKDFLPYERYPKSIDEIGGNLNYSNLSKLDQSRLNAAKNQFETYERRLGIQEAGITDMMKQKLFHSLADVVEKFTNKAAPSIRREGNREFESSMILQRAISTMVIAGSPLKQLILQLSPAFEALMYKALGRDKFIYGAPQMATQAFALRFVGILDHPSIKDQKPWLEKQIYATLKATGMSDIEIPHMIKEVKRTLSQVDRNILVSEIVSEMPSKIQETRTDKFGRIFKSTVGAPGTFGRIIGFKQSESATSVMSVLMARNIWQTNNPDGVWWEPKNRAEIARRAFNYKGSMTVEGAMPWSRNMTGQLFTFIQYEHKVVVEVLHEGGFAMTDAQRARFMLSKGILWGPSKIVVYGLIANEIASFLATYMEEEDVKEMKEIGANYPEYEARKKKIDFLNKVMEANLADEFFRQVFIAAGYKLPEKGSIVSESMASDSIPFWRIGSEIWKYFDGNPKTEPSFAAFQVPGKIWDSIKEVKNIWQIPESAAGFETASIWKKTQESFNAFLKNYKVYGDIEKAIINHANNYWIKNKNNRNQIQITPEENVLIALGWGSDKSNTYYKNLFATLDRKTVIENTAKTVHAEYQRLVDKFDVGEYTLDQRKSHLSDNMPWILNAFAGSNNFNKLEMQQIEELIYALERQKAKESGREALQDEIIKKGIQDSLIESKTGMEFFEKYGTEQELKDILDAITLPETEVTPQ